MHTMPLPVAAQEESAGALMARTRRQPRLRHPGGTADSPSDSSDRRRTDPADKRRRLRVCRFRHSPPAPRPTSNPNAESPCAVRRLRASDLQSAGAIEPVGRPPSRPRWGSKAPPTMQTASPATDIILVTARADTRQRNHRKIPRAPGITNDTGRAPARPPLCTGLLRPARARGSTRRKQPTRQLTSTSVAQGHDRRLRHHEGRAIGEAHLL
jgi:hypothetical protein